tara:strand:- start:233 stop:394 length:162 start_codon:yes stop_codon:yes gene_type:complete
MEKIPKNKNYLARLVFVLNVIKERVLSNFTGKQTTVIKIKSLNDCKKTVVYAG